MACGMMFCPVVAVVCGAGAPVKSELFLADAPVSQPVEAHVHGIGMFWLHPFVDDAFGCQIVNLKRGGWLLVAYVF